jgi:hydrogenase expression/formation protein HypD
LEDTSIFRDRDLARALAGKIRDLAPKESMKICHVCGTHEWTITHSGIRTIIPETVELIAGPGCPVCIVPAREIDEAVWLSMNGVTVVTFGDMYRAPGSDISLEDAKSRGGDVRVVYSVRDAVELAKGNPGREFVFFAIGFETTTPMNAVEAPRAPENLSFLISHRLIPPALDYLAELEEVNLSGVIAPGHVSTIIGMEPYRGFTEKTGLPVVIAGFEPMDVMMAVYMILKQLEEGQPRLENEYTRAVSPEGNVKAQEAIARVFDITDGAWRGLGVIPSSALRLKEEYGRLDAKERYEIDVGPGRDHIPGCRCADIIVGMITPIECSLFMKGCTPEKPKGACMVSVEGTCKIWASQSSRL